MKEKNDIIKIFKAGLNRADPYGIIKKSVLMKNNRLTVLTEEKEYNFDLSQYSEICVIGAGKATAKMAQGIEKVLGDRIVKGIISVKYGHIESLKKIEIVEAGHPIPDRKSIEASEKIISLCKKATKNTLIINLISGGGSSLLSLPYKDDKIEITLLDIQSVTKELLASGASIQEINCIRKHLSTIKGGRLADFIFPARCITLILSDVIGDRLDSIASGLTVPDPTTYQDAFNIIEKYKIKKRLPKAVQDVIEKGRNKIIADTPVKEDVIFSSITNILIGNNISALHAASDEAKKLGYYTHILTSQLTGEAREIAKIFAAIAKDIKSGRLKEHTPSCIIAGGETTVTLMGKGKGGRNQEMVLSFLNELYSHPDEADGVLFFSGGTDGNDGPTDAAGAIFTNDILKKCKQMDLKPGHYLENNDSYNFFKRLDGLIITGPTNTNVCDIQILLIK